MERAVLVVGRLRRYIRYLLCQNSFFAARVALTCIWSVFFIFTFAISYMGANHVCHQDFALGDLSKNPVLNCMNMSASIVFAFVSLKSIALLRFSAFEHTGFRHGILTWVTWSLAILFEVAVGIAAIPVVLPTPDVDASFVAGLMFLWICCVIIAGLLPAILVTTWQLRSQENVVLGGPVAADARIGNKACSERSFGSIPDLLREIEIDPSLSIQGVTVESDGWVSVSQRRLSKLLGLPLSSVHEAVCELRQSNVVTVDTSRNISRFRLVASDVPGMVLPGRAGGTPPLARSDRGRNTQHADKQKKTLPNNVVHGRWKRVQ